MTVEETLIQARNLLERAILIKTIPDELERDIQVFLDTTEITGDKYRENEQILVDRLSVL